MSQILIEVSFAPQGGRRERESNGYSWRDKAVIILNTVARAYSSQGAVGNDRHVSIHTQLLFVGKEALSH